MNEVTTVLHVQKYKEFKYSLPGILNFPELNNSRPIVHETADCHKAPINSFKKETKKPDRFSADRHLNVLCFYETTRTSNICEQNILAEGGFVTSIVVTIRGSQFDDLCGLRKIAVSCAM
jgi:hypothetical protein